ncbi:MAG: ATP synthase F1 subunit gamma [Bacteroidales bacterium]|nr:ATP synthase F1 subunit gamma [Bacteroidales bacterium]
MASLKEVRGRISSITSTRKITSAMQMVSAAKLRRAQDAIAGYLPYEQRLNGILDDFLTYSTDDLSIPLAQKREVKKLALVVISSNGSLCGAFNSNVIKKTDEILTLYHDMPEKDILFYPIGKKITDFVIKRGHIPQGKYSALTEKPNYETVAALADELISLFMTKQIDSVVLVYNHFKNAAVQTLMVDAVLPLLPAKKKAKQAQEAMDFIMEPDKDYLIRSLAPKVVRLKIYSALLDSIAAEHGARTTAMQTATENAADLIQELKLKYNKARQEAITKEIIDIVGGAESLR